jgi:GcrA cell cycle regulator
MKTNAPPLDPSPSDTAEAINRAGEMLRDLPGGCCCWPCGDPRDACFRWCGRAVALRSVYCNTHRAEAQDPGPNGAYIDLDSLIRRLKRP